MFFSHASWSTIRNFEATVFSGKTYIYAQRKAKSKVNYCLAMSDCARIVTFSDQNYFRPNISSLIIKVDSDASIEH